MADELIDICDEHNNLTGVQKMKSEAHAKGLWHRVAHVWIYNSKGEVLLQLRAKRKPLYPDRWDISAAGHVTAGEEVMVSALREVEEEIGLKVREEDVELVQIRKSDHVYKKIINREFCYVYLLRFDGDSKELHLQVEEVQEIKFLPIHKIEEELERHPEKYVAHEEYWFEMFKIVQEKVR